MKQGRLSIPADNTSGPLIPNFVMISYIDRIRVISFVVVSSRNFVKSVVLHYVRGNNKAGDNQLMCIKLFYHQHLQINQ